MASNIPDESLNYFFSQTVINFNYLEIAKKNLSFALCFSAKSVPMKTSSPLTFQDSTIDLDLINSLEDLEVLDNKKSFINSDPFLGSLSPVIVFERNENGDISLLPNGQNHDENIRIFESLLAQDSIDKVIEKGLSGCTSSGCASIGNSVYQVNCFTSDSGRLVGTILDITRLRSAEHESFKSSLKYKFLFNDAPIGVFKAYINGQLTEINSEFADLFGFSSIEDLLENCNNIFTLFSLSDSDAVFDIESMEPRRKYTLETKLKKPKGGFFWSRLTLKVIPDKAGRKKSIIGFVDNIDERKEKELKLKQSREQLHIVTENIADIVAETDSYGRIAFVNPAIESVLGYSQEYAIGKYFWEFIDPQFTDLLQNMYVRSTITPQVQKGEFLLRARDGRKVWIEGLGKPYFDRNGKYIGGVLSVRDITQRKRIEKAIAESESKYRSLFETSPDGIALLTLDGKPVNCNDKMLEICDSANVEELSVSNFSNMIFPKDMGFAAHIWHQLIADGFVESFVLPITTDKNNDKYVEVYAKIVRIKERPKWVLLIVKDISERKHAEIELMKSYEQLKELNSTKDKLFSIISHDLKNPISAFQSLTHMLTSDFDNLSLSEINELAVEMSKASTNIFKLLENLLIWSRSQIGQINLNIEEINITDLISSVIEQKKDSFAKKEIELQTNIQADLCANADVWMIYMVLRNLLSNARKFTPRGGTVEIIASKSADGIQIDIKDQGIGMDDLYINRLFRIEYSASSKGTEGETGSGLGLIICKEFILKNGGKIHVESAQGVGSTFTVILPVAV